MSDSASVTNLMLSRYVSRYGGDDGPLVSQGMMNKPADSCVCYPFQQNCCTHCGFQASCVPVCCNPLSSWLSCITFTHLLHYPRQQGHKRAFTTDVMFRLTLPNTSSGCEMLSDCVDAMRGVSMKPITPYLVRFEMTKMSVL